LRSILVLLKGSSKNVLCKAFRSLSTQDAKKAQWCDTLLPGQLLYQFDGDYILVLSPSGEKEELEEHAIMNRFPYGDRLLTMDEVVSELGLPSTIPSDCRQRRYLFLEKSGLQRRNSMSISKFHRLTSIKEGRRDDEDYPIQMVWFSSNSTQAKANRGLKIYR
jgi:hypothetical protein